MSSTTASAPLSPFSLRNQERSRQNQHQQPQQYLRTTSRNILQSKSIDKQAKHSSTANITSSSNVAATATTTKGNRRIYRSSSNNTIISNKKSSNTILGVGGVGGGVGVGVQNKFATREIAALDFLLNIPLASQSSIIKEGLESEKKRQTEIFGFSRKRRDEEDDDDDNEDYTLLKNKETPVQQSQPQQTHHHHHQQQQQNPHPSQRWWEKLMMKDNSRTNNTAKQRNNELEELERPDDEDVKKEENIYNEEPFTPYTTTAPLIAPGRRLEGRDDAVHITIPQSILSSTQEMKTRKGNITITSKVRSWELSVAHGVNEYSHEGFLDGRIFFSSRQSYPVATFSVVKYEPQKEEAARRRKKIEELGGGGSKFVLPNRDWRGVSYRSLLPHKVKKMSRYHSKNSSKKKNKSPSASSSSSSSSLSDDFSISSDKSDTYTPGFLDDPLIVQGRHRLVSVGDAVIGPVISSTIQFVNPQHLKSELNKQFRERFDGWEPPKPNRKYIGAKVIDGIYTLIDPSSDNEEEEKQYVDVFRMPPSLTLSKIRNIKEQALYAAVKADLEISTVALSCIYFERLCLDCRVDKSNRRLVFAACLLLAAKINEANVAIVHENNEQHQKKIRALRVLIRQTHKGTNMMASLLEFFTHEWSLSLKHVFSAEWGVFVALAFKLNAPPSQIAFHFKRLMKELERYTYSYLGHEMYMQWQQCLQDDEMRKERHELRKEKIRRRKERKLIKLEREIQLRTQQQQQQQHDNNEEEISTNTLHHDSLRSSNSNNENYRNKNDDETINSNTTPKSLKQQLQLKSLSRNTRYRNSNVDFVTSPEVVTPSIKTDNISSPSHTPRKPSMEHGNTKSSEVQQIPSSTLKEKTAKLLWNRLPSTKNRRQSLTFMTSNRMDDDQNVGTDSHNCSRSSSLYRSSSYPNMSSFSQSNSR